MHGRQQRSWMWSLERFGIYLSYFRILFFRLLVWLKNAVANNGLPVRRWHQGSPEAFRNIVPWYFGSRWHSKCGTNTRGVYQAILMWKLGMPLVINVVLPRLHVLIYFVTESCKETQFTWHTAAFKTFLWRTCSRFVSSISLLFSRRSSRLPL
jgi:hypothetical protein